MLPRVSAHRRHLIGEKCILNWTRNDWSMQMSQNSRGVDKALHVNNNLLQTLPKKDKRIRKAFIPSDNYELWFEDLDQVEYRLYAHYAKVPDLIEQIKNGYDIHAATAALIFNKDLDELIKKVHAGDAEASDLRSKAKTINFALTDKLAQVKSVELLESLKVNQQPSLGIQEGSETIRKEQGSCVPEAADTRHSVIKEVI